MPDQPYLENLTYDELTPGRTASLKRILSKEDIELFARVSGDINPAHLDEKYAKGDLFHGIVGHGMWTGALISAALGTLLPGPGTIYLAQDIQFKNPVRPGDEITITLSVREKPPERKPQVLFDCRGTNQNGLTVAEGIATVLAPTEKIRRPAPELPEVELRTHDRYRAIMESCQNLAPVRTAVVHPVQADVIAAVADAARNKLILPVLIGPRARIQSAAKEANIDITAWELVDTEHSHAAAAKAVGMAASGKIDALMKGSLHTDELLEPVVATASGLRTERRLSHVYVMDVASYPKPLFITDAVVNIAPDIATKKDICQNAITFWRALAHDKRDPKVAILAAVETVNPKMPATIDAAALCKMAERGQITGGIVDGPLALDNAISKAAAVEKGIVSPVAGDADILVAPDIEAANMLAKQLTFLGHADAAGIVLGARVPIILTSRADNLRTRLLSCAMAVLFVEARRLSRIK